MPIRLEYRLFLFARGEMNRPNILFINTDQQGAYALSVNDPGFETPNLDALYRQSYCFERAYAANPVCIPSRFSMYSGVYPSKIGMESNGDHRKNVSEEILYNAMGNIFSRNGYDCVYGGKIHLPGPSPVYEKVEPYGFTSITTDYRMGLSERAAGFLKEKHEKPFLLSLAFVNPHDICYYAYNRHQLLKGGRIIGHNGTIEWDTCCDFLRDLEGLSEEELDQVLPPLPDNFAIPQEELTSFRIDKPDFMCYSRNHFTEKDWRIVRYLYRRFVNKVDNEIGVVLQALKNSEYARNTLIVFTSDHGEMYGAHHADEKAFLYEECTRVPLMFCLPEEISHKTDNEHLVCSGIDILPTLCDFCNIPIPDTYEGRSLKGLIKGEETDWREYVIVENSMARMVHFGDYKYMASTNEKFSEQEKCKNCSLKCYEGQVVREQLSDLINDAGEKVNHIHEEGLQEYVVKGRNILSARAKERRVEGEERFLYQR